MFKKIVVAGSRDYNNYEEAKKYIDFCISDLKKTFSLIFISGGCRGADTLGERYAIEKGYKLVKMLAEWDKYGKSAGPKRNVEMAKACDYVICFWDGQSRGTKSMIDIARKLNKPIKIKLI